MNADERGFEDAKISVSNQRLSAVISGQLCFLLFQQAPIGTWGGY
jgi:hypothetical protein